MLSPVLRSSVDSLSFETPFPSTKTQKYNSLTKIQQQISPKNLMAMDGLSRWQVELKYRGLMSRLTDQITEQDMEKIKYMLTPLIPEGIKESLGTVIELFTFLEQILFVEPNNLGNLEKLFREMDKPSLYQMIRTFIHVTDTRTVESFQEFAMKKSVKIDPFVPDSL